MVCRRIEMGSVQEHHDEDQTGQAPRRRTIFLVEDEPQIRALIIRVLERAGFVVQSTDDPELALSVVSEEPGAIDLLLTDVLMPKMTGPTLVRALRQRVPDLLVLFMSGYAGDLETETLLLRDPLLRKPFVPKQLVEAVHDALGRRDGVSS